MSRKFGERGPRVDPSPASRWTRLGLPAIALGAALAALGGSALAAEPPTLGPRWAADWSAKSLDRVLAYYTPDAVFVHPTGERVIGKTALQTLFEQTLAANNPQIEMSPLTAGEAGAGGYEAGSYRETITPVAGGPALHFTGRYLLLIDTQSDGKRLIAEMLWTLDPQEGR